MPGLASAFEVMERLWSAVGENIPFACEDWTNTKATYRAQMLLHKFASNNPYNLNARAAVLYNPTSTGMI